MRNTRKRNVSRKRINKTKKNSSKRRIKMKRNISRRRIKTKRNITQKKINKTRNRNISRRRIKTKRNISRRRIKKKIIGGGFSFIPGLYLPSDIGNHFMELKNIDVARKTLGVDIYSDNSTGISFLESNELNIISYFYNGESGVLLLKISGTSLSVKFIILRRQCLNSAPGSNIKSWNIVIERIKKNCQILEEPYPKTDAEKDDSQKLVRLGIDCVKFSSGEVKTISGIDLQPITVIAKKNELIKMPEFNGDPKQLKEEELLAKQAQAEQEKLLAEKGFRARPPLFLQNLQRSPPSTPPITPPITPPSTPEGNR